MDKCCKCEAELGVDVGLAPYYSDNAAFCAPCSGHAAAVCRRCQVKFVDIGVGHCPFCRFRLISRV